VFLSKFLMPLVTATPLPTGASLADEQGQRPVKDDSFAALKPRNFLFIHGSWHTGSCWETVGSFLSQAGHHVHMPTLYGHGLDQPPQGVTLDHIAADVVRYMEDQQLAHVVLVPHSFGGIVAQRVYEFAPQRVSEIINFDTFLLQGESCLDIAAAQNPELVDGFRAMVKDDVLSLPFEGFAGLFMPDASPEFQHTVYDSLRPEPWGPLGERRDFPVFWFAVTVDDSQSLLAPFHLRTAYIVARNDLGIGPGFWEKMRSRLGPSCLHVELEAGAHEAMYTQPEALANAILLAARVSIPA
jgi:pimeloyl-ACP methyl ester carboxylesterase